MIKSVVSSALNSIVMGFSLVLVLFIVALTEPSFADEPVKFEGVYNKNPGADLWREVRQRNREIPGLVKGISEGASQVKGVDANILINRQGELWAKFRMEQIVVYAMIVLGSVITLVFLFAILRGKINIKGGLSGYMVPRFNSYERVLHWVLALVFLFLALTGLALLFGRSLLIPLLGHEVFAVIASASKEGHNLIGPLFLVSVLLMLIRFVKQNIYEKGDLTWLLKGGGMIGKSHVTGGFFNMGEKSWYWMVILVGLLISLSGLILVSPNWGQGRVIMELSHLVHVAGALLLMTIACGHMYLGSIGTEGTNESMRTGYVDINWARAHHDRWAKECEEKQLIIAPEDYATVLGKNSPAQQSSVSLKTETSQ